MFLYVWFYDLTGHTPNYQVTAAPVYILKRKDKNVKKRFCSVIYLAHPLLLQQTYAATYRKATAMIWDLQKSILVLSSRDKIIYSSYVVQLLLQKKAHTNLLNICILLSR